MTTATVTRPLGALTDEQLAAGYCAALERGEDGSSYLAELDGRDQAARRERSARAHAAPVPDYRPRASVPVPDYRPAVQRPAPGSMAGYIRGLRAMTREIEADTARVLAARRRLESYPKSSVSGTK